MAKKNKHLCSCGSGKHRKICCRETPSSTWLAVSRHTKLEARRTVEAFAKAGKHLEACEILEKLAALSPRNPLIWNDLGVQYEAAGQIDRAIVALKRGHHVDSTYPPTLYNLGKFTLDRLISLHKTAMVTNVQVQKMLAEAIRYLNANLDRDPNNVDSHYYLALAHSLNQDEPTAQTHMAVALRLRQALGASSGWRLE